MNQLMNQSVSIHHFSDAKVMKNDELSTLLCYTNIVYKNIQAQNHPIFKNIIRILAYLSEKNNPEKSPLDGPLFPRYQVGNVKQ